VSRERLLFGALIDTPAHICEAHGNSSWIGALVVKPSTTDLNATEINREPIRDDELTPRFLLPVEAPKSSEGVDMGLGPAAVKLYLELWQRKILDNLESVMEMGSQSLHIPKAELEELVTAAGVPGYNEKAFPDYSDPSGLLFCSSRPFYELLGARQYRCIDLGKQYGAIPHDLNQPFTDESLFGQFDLVTDHGTNEHVFNIAETYRTMHRMCKSGGIIVIEQALYGGNGYYNFDLSFFEGMAAANNYSILFCSYAVTTRTNNVITQHHIPISRDLLNAIDWSKIWYVEICYVFRKNSKDDFKYAYQGEYQADVQGHHGYRLQFLSDPPSRTYVPLRGQSQDGIEADVLSSIALPKLVRHLVWRGSGRIKARISRRLRRWARWT
jgi:hypothetical protein